MKKNGSLYFYWSYEFGEKFGSVNFFFVLSCESINLGGVFNVCSKCLGFSLQGKDYRRSFYLFLELLYDHIRDKVI